MALSFESETAINMISVLIEEDPEKVELDSVGTGTLCEVGNMIINSLMGSITNILEGEVQYSLPEYTDKSLQTVLDLYENVNNVIIVADTLMTIEKLHASGKLLVVFKVGYLEQLLKAIE